MSFREKMAWVSLLATLGVWGFYFWELLGAGGDAPLGGAAAMALFVRCVVLVVVIEVGVAVVAPAVFGREAEAPADEREQLVELKATRAAYVLLTVLAVCLVVAAPALAGAAPYLFADPLGDAALAASNGLLLAVLLSGLLKSAWQIVGYRLGR